MSKRIAFPTDKAKRKTAGELAKQAIEDQTVYDSLEVGTALTEDTAKQLQICVENHDPIFLEDEYFVVMQFAGDPLLKNMLRRKFYADLYLPDPRPRQTVFLYSKVQQKFLKRLWVLPDVDAMEILCQMTSVNPKYRTMQVWSQWFYAGTFWQNIRAQHDIKHLSKTEYLETHRTELAEASGKQVEVLLPDAFDFSKVSVEKVIDANKSRVN